MKIKFKDVISLGKFEDHTISYDKVNQQFLITDFEMERHFELKSTAPSAGLIIITVAIVRTLQNHLAVQPHLFFLVVGYVLSYLLVKLLFRYLSIVANNVKVIDISSQDFKQFADNEVFRLKLLMRFVAYSAFVTFGLAYIYLLLNQFMFLILSVMSSSIMFLLLETRCIASYFTLRQLKKKLLV